jgi:hypothetical protein
VTDGGFVQVSICGVAPYGPGLQVRLQALSRLAGGGRHFSFSKKEK